MLLSFRTAIKIDSNVPPAEHVYGAVLRLSDDFFNEQSITKSPKDVVKELSGIFHSFTPAPTKSHNIAQLFLYQDLKSCTHVFIGHGGVRKELQPLYCGHYASVQRSAKLYKV